MYSRSRIPPRTLGELAIVAGLFVAGCGMLPSAGPSVGQVLNQETRNNTTRFAVVDIDQRVIAGLSTVPQPNFSGGFPQRDAPPEPKIGIGDSVVVSIWEAAAGGLFSSTPIDGVTPGSHSVALPEQVVGRDGAISVPFAGRIPVAGRLPLDAQRAIEQRLTGKAIDPQAIVSVTKSVNNTATVTGEVAKGGRLPLSLKGDRILDLIAEAGGPRTPIHETSIRLSRGAATATIPMEELVSDSAENIYAEPGDVLTVVRTPQSFTVFGATGQNNEIDFPSANLTLIEGLAKAGGLQDFRSDPTGVFLFRWEVPAVATALGIKPEAPGPDGRIEVVYRLDLSDPKAYFAAERFPLRDRDIVYVANASSTELEKFLELINGLTGPAVTGAVVKNATQ
jgi:polysaccharide biosynthesis/export protein